MKRTLLTIALLLTFVVSLQAQWTSNTNPKTGHTTSEYRWLFQGQLDTAAATYDSLASVAFEMDGVSSLEYIQVDYLFYSATGTPKICVDWFGSDDNSTWTLIEQVVDTTTGETHVFQQTVLTNARPKFNKLVVEQVALGRDNSTFKVWVRAKKD